MTRLGILLSGRGSNFRAIQEAIERGELAATIACVVSNVPGAAGIGYAREKGLRVFALDSRGVGRADFDERVLGILRDCGVEMVCLAGYMRLLSPGFVAAYAGRILNVHPSLLPAFKGMHAQRQALEAGVSESGCTVHYVDEGLDSGEVILQGRVAVLPGDTEGSLSERILEEEHRVYPLAIARAISGLARGERS